MTMNITLISSSQTTHLPCMTETRKPADLIFSISDRVILCLQQALTWPSKPWFDCIPVADIPFTYCWYKIVLLLSFPTNSSRYSCKSDIKFLLKIHLDNKANRDASLGQVSSYRMGDEQDNFQKLNANIQLFTNEARSSLYNMTTA